MTTIAERIANLSPAKRSLLEAHLQKQQALRSHEPIHPYTGNAPVPLSPAQERLWFLDQLETGTTAYHEQSAQRLVGALQVDALAAGLAAVVQRHTIWRTIYRQGTHGPIQLVDEAMTIPLRQVDLRALAPPQQTMAIQVEAQCDVTLPFDLTQGPIVRFTLLRLAEHEHILIHTVHHIANDGWSDGIFWRELSAFYNAHQQNTPASLPALPIQYADYAIWQRAWLAAGTSAQQRSYWRKQLAGLSPLALPTDRPRPRVQRYRGAQHSCVIARTVTTALNQLARAENATLFIVLITAFQVLLHRYSGQTDIAIGSPIAGRRHSEVEQLIGFFINTLVLRGDLAGNPPFRALVRQLRTVCFDAYANQDLPFAEVVAEVQPVRALNSSPLFQVFFTLQNMPHAPLQLNGIIAEPYPLGHAVAKFDLSLYVHQRADELEATFEYNTDLFDTATIERMATHFGTLLAGIAADADQSVGQLPLLTAAERQQLLVDWNDTHMDYPADVCIHQLFEAQVARRPAATAVIGAAEQITYGELNARANQLAHKLLALGVGPGANVGLCAERSIAMIVGVLAILKAGAAYVPLDPAYPAARCQLMLTEANITLLLTQRQLASFEYAGPVIYLEDIAYGQSQGWTANPACAITPDSVAYVLFTSGSTGTPKGVMGLHRGAVNRIHWMAQTYPWGPDEICCQKTSLNFVDSVAEIFGPLAAGIPLVLIADDIVRDPARLIATLAHYQITRLVLVPSLLQALLAVPLPLSETLQSIKLWIASGEALPAALVTLFQQRLPGPRLLNVYGSSEVSADVSWYAINPPLMENTGHNTGQNTATHPNVPIGRPIANTQLYLLDGYGQPTPIGVPGTLHVGGVGLARGYLSPTLTADSFRPNPFAPGLLYTMGDRARYLPDGNIEFLGRTDNQCKIRGFRVELGEIEAALRSHPAIQAAVVTMSDRAQAGVDADIDNVLVAYLVAPTKPSAATVRAHLADRLPTYMLPAAFRYLDTLPLTLNGKIDRHALPAAEPLPGDAYVAPRTAVERQLATIWRNLLGIDQVGIHDNFFVLGGHSLLTVRLLAQVEREFNRKLPLDAFFYTPTIAHLVHLLAVEMGHQPIALKEVAPAGLLPAQRAAIQALIEQLSDPSQPQRWQRVLEADHWHRRRKAISRAVGCLPYPLTQRCLAQFFRLPWWRQQFFGKEVALTQQFLAAIDHPSADTAAIIARSLRYNYCHYYQLLPKPQVNAPQLLGSAILDAAKANGQGVILLSSHDNLPITVEPPALTDAFLVGGIQNYLAYHQIHDEPIAQALFSHQLHAAHRVLQAGGMVKILPDGHRGHRAGMEIAFHGRRRLFRRSFAELALMTGATVIVLVWEEDTQGTVRGKLIGPLEAADETLPHAKRVEHLIMQYVAILRRQWAEAPWLVPWYQMKRHLAYPLSDNPQD